MTTARERRISPRIRQREAGRVVDVRVKPGIDVVLVDVSAHGLLLETTRRLLPGAQLDLHVSERGGRAAALRGHVVRCSVSALLPGEVRYLGAVRLERDQPWLTEPALATAGRARQEADANPSCELDTQQSRDDTAHTDDSTADSRGRRPEGGWHRVW